MSRCRHKIIKSVHKNPNFTIIKLKLHIHLVFYTHVKYEKLF